MWSWWFPHILHHFIDGRARYRCFVGDGRNLRSHIFRLSVSLADWYYHQIAMKQCVCVCECMFVFTQPHCVLCIPICISFGIYVALDSCMRFQPLKIHAFHFVCFFAPIYCVLNLLFAPLSYEMYFFLLLAATVTARQFCLSSIMRCTYRHIFHFSDCNHRDSNIICTFYMR